jgi:pyruvate/2-oxoglutarate dehydrogenase complex dihydrolipoamide dehydrogenase (E3) component
MEQFDAIIIGAGQSGVPLSKKLAKAGWKTALIEKRLIGGTCINDGCTPTKTLIASARMAYMAGRSADLGIDIPTFEVNFKRIMERQAGVVQQFRSSATKGVQQSENLTVIFGEAKFIDNHTLQVTSSGDSSGEYTAKYIFVDTGASPAIPDTPGLNEITYLDSTSILALRERPEHLLIVGGGYIALEYAQMFRRFGSEVTILERSERMMGKEDEDLSELLTETLKAEGVNILTQTKVSSYEKLDGEKIAVHLENKAGANTITCSHVLIAVGRKPQTLALGFENTSIKTDDHGFVVVDEFLQTDVEGVYALGDVNGGPAFTHISYNDYIIVSKNLLEGAKQSTLGRQVPYCVFTDPQVGRIGMGENEAREKGIDFLVAKIPMENVARAIESSETRGFMKAIVDKHTRQILGATVIGEQGGETMTVIQLAMAGGLTCDQLKDMIFAHPLYAESINNLFMTIA